MNYTSEQMGEAIQLAIEAGRNTLLDCTTAHGVKSILAKLESEQRLPEKAQHVGFFDPGSRRLCYTDEQEHRPDHFKGYTVKVYAIPEAEGKS